MSRCADPHEAAAFWFARHQSGEMSDMELQVFEAWKASDSAHEREYQALQQVWTMARHIPANRLRALADDGNTRFPPQGDVAKSNGWRSVGATFAFLFACIAGFAGYQWQQAQPTFNASVDTPQGKRQKVALPDGSSVDVNIRTHMRIDYYRDRRIAILDAGEVSFNIVHDTAKPFLVDAGSGQIRVTGTQFNVRRDSDEVFITVVSGTVVVSSMAGSSMPPARLTAGMGMRIDAKGHADEPHGVNVAAVTAWREGKLVFDNQPLAEVVREVTRYRLHPVRIAGTSADLGQLRLSSTFSINDTEALLVALPRILPVKIRREPDGSVEIYRP
ncbi:hypothetical protein SQ11_14845 [Nitrosospira sp. NpAV]|nr:hypothetical protein SQ11_14845 [Nitrosospira sp. NpAV]